ncbi:YopX family protein [Bacillus sp. MCCB 382]|uniref:YopX family protein n=1 Tax=Bacillus sp. MCCB 382 TaxID=2860197 RepID=UPI001C58427B|nr:YopX family protein [Bacillus sp. MCCB 382]
MREIKFRAWDNVKKEMYFVGEEDDVVFSIERFGTITATDISEHDWGYPKLEHLQYMQSTGLKDKEDKEIYEKDIVYFNDFAYDRTGGHVDDNILKGEVEFSCGSWTIVTEKGIFELYNAIVNDQELEIIGNAYQGVKS